MEKHFTLDEALELMPDVLSEVDELVEIRGRLTVAMYEHQAGNESVSLADVKADEARMSELLDGFRGKGLQVKGWAPVLLDFPMHHEGREVLLCLLEGERSLEWYHDAEHGFAGRRRISELGL